MTLQGLALAVTVLAGCTSASAEKAPPRPAPQASGKRAAAPPPPAPVRSIKARVAIELTAVTLADDCGGTAPRTGPALIADAKAKAKRAAKSDAAHEVGARARARRRCEQTSMQLSITAAHASRIQVKSVELFDDAGTSLGTLAPSKPTRWSIADSTYQAWDQTVPAGATASVSYVLAQPDWTRIGNRWNRTYVLKTVISVNGIDRPAHKEFSLRAPTSVSSKVKT